MPVITVDILLEGARRDAVFDWLGDPANHRPLLEGAFEEVKQTGEGTFDLTFKAPPRTQSLGYALQGKDDSHGGRRIVVHPAGRRTQGELHYSLRTMKPSSNTLVTLRLDYNPGSVLGSLRDGAGLRQALEERFATVLGNLKRELVG